MKLLINIIAKHMVTTETLKMYTIQAFGFLSAFTTIDVVLKAILVIASIGYTVAKTVSIVKNEILKKKDDEK